MLFWIILAIAIVSTIWCVKNSCNELLILICAVSCIASVVLSIWIIAIITTAPGYRAANIEIYKSLMYKAQTEACRDEFGIVNKDYIDEIQKWNTDLAKGKTLEHDFWIGIFVEDIYDDFDYIDLDKIIYKSN